MNCHFHTVCINLDEVRVLGMPYFVLNVGTSNVVAAN